MLKFKNIGLTVKSELDHRDESVARVLKILEELGAKLFVDPERCTAPDAKKFTAMSDDQKLDLLVVIGGDGTILRSVRERKQPEVPLLTVNRGDIGFLTELSLSEAETELPPLLEGAGVIDERSMLTIKAYRGKKLLAEADILNEAVIAQGSIARLVHLKTSVGGEPLTTYRSDGLILATPTGSTAYSLAAGGPIVHPKQAALILTPINPHSFNQKPIVLPESSVVDVEVLSKATKYADLDVILTFDGQTSVRLQSGDHITAETAKSTVRFLRRKSDTFLTTLRAKLEWGGRDEH